jgi:hypothetical protein
MQRDLSVAENRLLGVLAFVVDGVPVAIFLGAASMLFVGAFPSSLGTAAALVFIIAIGLRIPVMLIVGELARERVPNGESRKINCYPFAVFLVWWRYVR